MLSGVTSLRGAIEARGGIVLYLAAVYVGIYMVVGINPRRFIAASPSDTIGLSYRSHQVYFSKTVVVKVPPVH